jgi:hypothetical protein
MDKAELLQDSVKKLISLGVSDAEILESLAEVGVSKEDAKKLVNDVRSGALIAQKKESEGVFEQTAKALGTANPGMNAQQLNQTNYAQISPNPNQQTKSPNVVEISQEHEEINPMEVDFGVEINEDEDNQQKKEPLILKKEEAKKVEQEKIEDVIQQTAPELIQPIKDQTKETKKEETKTSTKPLGVADKIIAEISGKKIDERNLEEKKSEEKKYVPKISDVKQSDVEELWKKGIVIAINAKLDEMRKLKEEIESEIDSKVDTAVRKETKQFKVLLDSQKDLIISSNKEALAEKQQEITFIIDSKIAELKKYNHEIEDNLKKINELKEEQEKTVKELSESLENLKKTKTQLVMEMNSELIKSKSKAQEFLDNSDKHLQEMDERINKTLELEKNIAEGMMAKAEQKIEQMTLEKANELVDELQIELNKIKSIEKEVSIESLDDKIKMLNQFKSEFLNSMQQNITKINSAIDRLNEKNATVEKELKGRMLIFDAKIEELTKFEKEFGETMENYLKKDAPQN